LTPTASCETPTVYEPGAVSDCTGAPPKREVVVTVFAYAGVAAEAEPEYGSTTFTSVKPTAAVNAKLRRTARERTCGRLTATPTGLAGDSGTISATRLPTITEP
jgi:hypothetical protein